MSDSDHDLLAGLRRSTDPADRRLADLLGGLVEPTGRRVAGPRASEALAAFLAANDPIAAAPLDTVPEPAAPDLVVELGRTPPRRATMRSYLVPLRTLLRTSLLAKVVLGTTVALTGAGAVAATTDIDTGRDTVTVVPASDPGDAGTSGDDTPGVVEVDDDHEGTAHEGDADDGPDPDDADGPDGADDHSGQDPADDDQGDDGQGGDDQGDDESGDDESGDDQQGDDQGDDSGHESSDDGQGDDDQGDDESGNDDHGDDSGAGSGGDDSGDESSDDGSEDSGDDSADEDGAEDGHEVSEDASDD